MIGISYGGVLQRIFAFLFISILTFAAGFSPSHRVAAQDASRQTLTYAMYADIKDWDPAVAFSLEAILLQNVYEPLVWYQPEEGGGGAVIPALATAWSRSADGLTWTFTLRKNVVFHDGAPFDAAAARASLERTIALGQGASYIWDPVEQIEAPDAETLVIRTREPAPIDLIASSQYGAYIVSPRAGANKPEWFNEGRAAGTGPYTVRQWIKGQQVVLESYQDYWDGQPIGSPDRVILRVVLEAATQAQMIRSGAADIISLAPVDLLASLDAREDVNVVFAPSWINSQFLINTQKYPTGNLAFRQALTHAWDYATVVREIYEGSASVARGVIPATMWGHDPDLQVPGFDLEKAARLLKQSGIPRKDWRLRASYINTSTEYTNALLYFQALLGDLGVDLQLRPGPWTQIWDEAKANRSAPHMISMTWWPTYPTPADWLVGLFRTEERTLFNLSRYANPAFDTLVDQGRRLEALNRKQAIEKYRAAQRLLIRDAPAIFYADVKARLVYRSDLRNVEINPAYTGVKFRPIRRTQ